MIVLDTHAWVWWVSAPDKLSSRATSAINDAKRIGICPISCWEISMKVTMGRLEIDRDVRLWVREALGRPRVVVLQLFPEIAAAAGQLPRRDFHGDPADRLIVATTLHHDAELVTKDGRIRSYAAVRTIW